MTLQLYLHSATILFLLSFNVFGRACNLTSKIIVSWWVLTCDSGSESEPARFDRFQLRLMRKRSTPTDSNPGLDSDSAALIRIIAQLKSGIIAIVTRAGRLT